MNHVLSLLRSARTSGAPDATLYSDLMLSQLLALHEEMIVQLCLERLEVVGTSDFLTGMIDQHEEAAAQLRAQLKNRGRDTPDPF